MNNIKVFSSLSNEKYPMVRQRCFYVNYRVFVYSSLIKSELQSYSATERKTVGCNLKDPSENMKDAMCQGIFILTLLISLLT